MYKCGYGASESFRKFKKCYLPREIFRGFQYQAYFICINKNYCLHSTFRRFQCGELTQETDKNRDYKYRILNRGIIIEIYFLSNIKGMAISGNGGIKCDYGRDEELKAFDGTKLGVQGLVDGGNLVKVPGIFLRSSDELAGDLEHSRINNIILPIIDLDGLFADKRKEIVDQVRSASEEWGFFRVVNHGIPFSVLSNMIEAGRKFHEQEIEVKKEFYSRDTTRRVRFNSNHDLFQSARADWRDTFSVSMLRSDHIDPAELPAICRKETMEFINQIGRIGDTLFELLSEGLGLKPDYLNSIECNKGRTLVCHYYPACPEPDMAMGVTKHTDNTFLTVLAEDQTGGLQVLHGNQWIDVEPIVGSLVVNIGDLLQVVSNDKFKSNVHRVLPSRVPRVSVIGFFAGRVTPPARLYGPIKELLSEENPPKYREILVSEYVSRFFTKGLHEKPSIKDYLL